MKAKDTITELLDTAQGLVNTRGYNAFSYKDLAESVGIRTASIHYHFRTKADLGVCLMQRYSERLELALADIESKKRSNLSMLKAFIQIYRTTEDSGAICLCGSLASDHGTLTGPLQELVTQYLERSENWIADRLHAGVSAGEFSLAGKPAELAVGLLSGLQGGLILARARPGHGVLDQVARSFYKSLGSA
jgi:TetR/AcrR family transcriptional repressor of nem operon